MKIATTIRRAKVGPLAVYGMLLAASGAVGAYIAYATDPDAKPVPAHWVCPARGSQLANVTVTTSATRKARSEAWRGLRASKCWQGTSERDGPNEQLSFTDQGA